MIFRNRWDARDWFLKFKECKEIESIPGFWEDYKDLKNWEFGDWILFQELNSKGEISRPIYGVFVSFNIWDQALVLHYQESPRAWMRSHEVANSLDSEYSDLYAAQDPRTDYVEFWTGNIKVLGWWKNKPTLSQLREAYAKKDRQVLDTA